MKNKKLLQMTALFLCVAVTAATVSSDLAVVKAETNANVAEGQKKEEKEATENTAEVIHIKSPSDLQKFAEACITDAYSTGKVFSLDADLDVRGEKLAPIPIFCGTFEGNGHTISGYVMEEAGSDMGFFRFVEKEGIVRNLTIQGKLQPTGTGINIGGIAGTNRGTIQDCRFEGEVIAKEAAGGIVGYNEATGLISGCRNEGKLLGTKKTGGIAGINEGRISNCINEGNINATAETVKEAEGDEQNGMNLNFSMDFSTMMTDEDKITSTGGIAGTSEGVVENSTNHGVIGYPHVGYRVGGIVGYQRGCVDNCRNDGKVQGRKNIGGIVGLFEPYVEINYEEGTSGKLRRQMDDLIDMLSDLSDIAKDADNDTIDNMDAVGDSIDSIKDSIDGYKDYYSDQNDVFLDDLEEALDIVERRIDMLDFNVDGESIVASINGIKSDMDKALAILEAIQKMGISGGGAAGSSTGIMTTSEAVTGEETGSDGNSTGNDSGNTGSDSGSAGNDSGSTGNGSGSTGNDSGSTGNDSSSTGNGSGSTGNDSSSTGNDGGSTGNDSSSTGNDSSSTGNDGGSTGNDNTASLSGSVMSIEETIFRAAPSGGSMTQEEMMQLLNELGISQEDIIRALIAAGYDPTIGIDPNDPVVQAVMQKLIEKKMLELAGNMEKESDKLNQAARDAVGEGKSLVDNADKLGTEIKHVIHVVENHMKDFRDDLKETDEDLSAQMDELDAKIDDLKDRLRDANDDVIAQMDRITDQMHLINDTASDGLDDLEEKINDPDADKELSDYYDDLSDSTDTTQQKGKVLNSQNEGEIISDINGGGIAGSISVEWNTESDFEIVKTGDRSLDSKRTAVGTIYNCKNRNEVTAQNDYAGGIVGRADLGAVVACQNYGDVETTDGDYAGGIAGKSDYMIRNSYTLCNITGHNYTGGIVGEGSSILNNYGMTSVFTEDGEKFGAIAGDADGDVSGNYFVDDGIAAVNGLTYASQAAPVSYEKLIELEETPADFQKFTIRFMGDEGVIKILNCGYGESLSEKDIPAPPERDGILGTWDKLDFTNIHRNMVVRAVYEDWTTALSTGEDVPKVLVSGQFYPDAVLRCEQLNLEELPQLAGYEVKEGYHYQIVSSSTEQQDTVGIHVLTDGYYGKVRAALVRDGKLQLVDGKMDGRYYVFESDQGTEGAFVILKQEINMTVVTLCIAAVLAVILILLVHTRKARKRKAKKQLQGEEEQGKATEQKKTTEQEKEPAKKKTRKK